MRKLLARLTAWLAGEVDVVNGSIHDAESSIAVWSEKQLYQLKTLEFSLNHVLDNFENRLIALEKRLEQPAVEEHSESAEQPADEPPSGGAQ